MIASRAIHTLRLPDGRPWTLGERTLVMGILNVTPDSFADGGRLRSIDAAVAKGLAMVEAGADLLDLGGESTRPGAAPVAADEELRRVIPVVRRLAAATAVPLSIDTTKAEVARAALAEGATIVNDVSGLQYDAALGSVVAESGAPLVVMHMRGTPASMYAEAVYGDVVAEVAAELAKATARAAAEGIPRGQIVLDPGLAADPQQVAEALRRHEGHAGALVLDHGVGRERRPMDHALDRGRVDAGRLEQPADAAEHALLGRARRRQLLHDVEPAVAPREHDVGEGPADVGPEYASLAHRPASRPVAAGFGPASAAPPFPLPEPA